MSRVLSLIILLSFSKLLKSNNSFFITALYGKLDNLYDIPCLLGFNFQFGIVRNSLIYVLIKFTIIACFALHSRRFFQNIQFPPYFLRFLPPTPVSVGFESAF